MCELVRLAKALHSCSWGKRPAGFSAKKPASISSVSKALNVWVKTLDSPSPALLAVDVCVGSWQGDDTEPVSLWRWGLSLFNSWVCQWDFASKRHCLGSSTAAQEMLEKQEKHLLVMEGGCCTV